MESPGRVAFTLFGKDIYWYGVLMAVGIILAVFLAYREQLRKKMNKDTVIDICLVIIPCGIVGARLFYVLFELKHYLSDPIRMLYIWEGGLAIYGAVIFGFLGLLIYCRKKKVRFLRLADLVAPGLVLAQAIGRWGNFFNSEAFGVAITEKSMQWFPLAVKIPGAHFFNGAVCTDEYHLATFFIESLWCLLIFIFIWTLRKDFKHDGDMLLWYALLYGFERFFVEGLRGDSLWLIPDVVRVSQLISIILFVGILAFMIVRASKEKKLGVTMWPSMPAPEVLAQMEQEQQAAQSEEEAEEQVQQDSEPAQEEEPQQETEEQPQQEADQAQEADPEE